MKAIPSKSTGLDSAQSGLCAMSSIKNTLVTNGPSPQLDCELLEGETLFSKSKKQKTKTNMSSTKAHAQQSVNSHKSIFIYMFTLLNSSLVRGIVEQCLTEGTH